MVNVFDQSRSIAVHRAFVHGTEEQDVSNGALALPPAFWNFGYWVVGKVVGGGGGCCLAMQSS